MTRTESLHRAAATVRGMVLAQAYAVLKASGVKLRVAKIDGVPVQPPPVDADQHRLIVEVANGLVYKAWTG